MEKDSKEFKYLIYSTGVGILALLIFLIIIIYIWSRPTKKVDDTQTVDKDIGKYTSVSVTNDEQVNKYFSAVSTLLAKSNIDELYNLLDDSYLKYTKYDKQKFKQYILSKNLYDKKISMKEYKSVKFANRNVIEFAIYAGDKDNIKLDVTLFETLPNQYTIAFDKFIAYYPDEVNYESNGIKVTLKDQEYFSDEYRANMKISNTGTTNVTFNKSAGAEVVYLNQGADYNTIVNTHMFMGEEYILQPNVTLNYNIKFSISDFTFSSIKKILIKDVTNANNNTTNDIECNIEK